VPHVLPDGVNYTLILHVVVFARLHDTVGGDGRVLHLHLCAIGLLDSYLTMARKLSGLPILAWLVLVMLDY
jgi:hypothetical protein